MSGPRIGDRYRCALSSGDLLNEEMLSYPCFSSQGINILDRLSCVMIAMIS